jgi:DNA repair photolyase
MDKPLELGLPTAKDTSPALTQYFPSSPARSFNGPISGPMWKKVSSLNSSYPDTFDYGVYDKLYDYFGDNQPWRGVVFKTTFKLVNYHTSCTQCHYAFEIDTYGRGCIHDCVYCYAKEALSQHGFWNRPMPFPVDLSEVRKILYTVFETDKTSKWRSVLERRTPLRIGSMSDSFMRMDKKYGISKELLRLLSFYDYPYIVFTRGDVIADDDYLSLLRKDLASIQFSISGENERLTRLLEPAAPSVAKRLGALKTLADAGLWTSVRINPLFPKYPDGYFTNRKAIIERFGSKEAIPTLNLLDIDNLETFFGQLKDARVPSIVVGFVRLSSTAIKAMSKSLGTDVSLFFSPENLQIKGDKKYSDSEIAFYYKKIQSAAETSGIRFNTCYIGNGEKDYYQYQNLWSNKADCCDARGNVQKFLSSSQEIPWDVREKHLRGPGSKEMAQQAKNQSLFYSNHHGSNQIH